MTNDRRMLRGDRNDHLPSAAQYRNDVRFQRRLDNFFRRTEGHPALERLDELGSNYHIGGAKPYITIRSATADRAERMIVIRHSESGEEKSPEIPAGEMTKEDARLHPGALAALDKFSEDKLFELRCRNAPATVSYSSALFRYLATRDPSSGDAAADETRRKTNRKRNVRDPQETFDAMTSRAKVLIAELFMGRTLQRPPTGLPTEIKEFLVRRSRKAGVAMDAYGQYAGAFETNVAAYVSVVRQTLEWLKDTYAPPISLSMKPFNPKGARSIALKWSECRNVMLWSQGYVFENGGFAKHWIERDGELRLEWKKLPEPLLSEHRDEFLPLLRFVPTLALTGSRPTVGSMIGWNDDDHLGRIEFDGARSRILRTGTYGANYSNKPRNPSALTPLARRFFEVCLAKDAREGKLKGWPLDRVIHDGRGGPVTNLSKLFKRACDALGIDNSAKKLKHLAVTMHWLAGFELRRVARIVGTDPGTTEKSYLYLEDEYPGLMRPRPDPESMTFADLADPLRDIAPIPRTPAPSRPAARDESLPGVPPHA